MTPTPTRVAAVALAAATFLTPSTNGHGTPFVALPTPVRAAHPAPPVGRPRRGRGDR